jgi:hypothetical protein
LALGGDLGNDLGCIPLTHSIAQGSTCDLRAGN